MEQWLKPGDLVFLGPESSLYRAHEDAGDCDVPTTDDWKLVLIIGTDHVKAANGQHPWFLVLVEDALHYVSRNCLMTLDRPLSRIGQ